MAAGLRVLRGPDWGSGDEDGGEGHVGTVVEVKDNTAIVVWDGGHKSNCRIGGGKHDLRILDNATIGVRHDNVECDACSERRIQGIRWKCTSCSDYDLCSLCYVTGAHDITHQFQRFTTSDSQPVEVEKRNKSMKVRAMGIFPGATVKRGQDWKYDNDDGGPGKVGEVTEIVTPEISSARSAVRVKWGSGVTRTYRLGHQGKVDLMYVDESPGVDYYPTHLPTLDAEEIRQMEKGQAGEGDEAVIGRGDLVYVELDVGTLKAIQKQRGGWSVGMTQIIGKIGEVKGFTMSGDAEVAYGDTKWRLFPGALRKVPKLAVGQSVRLRNDEEKVKALQEGHGGFNDDMRECLGKVGRIVKKDSDGDFAVNFGRRTWLFSPAVLDPVLDEDVGETDKAVQIYSGVEDDDDDDNGDGNGSTGLSQGDALEALFGLAILEALREHLEQATGAGNFRILVQAITQGDLQAVQSAVSQNPGLLRESTKGLTPLHIAAHEGQLDILRFLVRKGAELNAQDDDGDTALHIALGRNKLEEAALLVQSGCDVNLSNKKQHTPVHYAAFIGNAQLLSLIVSKNCDINKQDADGDTPLHECIEKGHSDCIEVLLTSPRLNPRLANKRGLNALHFAALKGSDKAVQLILNRHKTLVNEAKEDGFTALHIAAFNDHTQVLVVLLKAGAAVNAATIKRQTPLHLACEEAYMSSATKLIEHRADVMAKDEDGDTPLHAVMGGGVTSPFLRLLMGRSMGGGTEVRVRLACYLLQHGADVTARNKAGRTPLEVTTNQELAGAVRRFAVTVKPTPRPSPSQPTTSQVEQCSSCHRDKATIVFLPCAHKASCRKCAEKAAKCPKCGNKCTAKVDENGKKLSTCTIQ